MLSTSRRTFTWGALAALGSAGFAAAEPPPDLAFAAFRNGKRIGEQRMSFEAADGALTVRTRAEMAVKLGPVTVYRYRHEAVERWRSGRFESLETRTAATGSREEVVATRGAGGVLIRAGKARLAAPAAALPFTHWNPQVARAPLFNPQTGKLLALTVQELGAGAVALADGRSVQARRVAFTGDAEIEDWYDAAGVWTGLRGRLDDGSTMEYRRL